MVVDALSRVSSSKVLCLALSVLDSNLSTLIKASYSLDVNIQNIITQLQQGLQLVHFTYIDGLLRKKHKLVIGPDDNLKQQILKWLHDSAQVVKMQH